MIIAVDDAGDPGLKLKEGSSKFFIIAAVLFEDDLDAEETALKIKRLRQKLGWQQRHEFKFRKTSPEIRKLFLSEIKNCKFEVSLVILNKADVAEVKEFKNDASKLYNAVILKSLQAFDGKLKQTHILVDGESGSTYRRNVKTFFRKHLPKGTMRQLTYRNSVEDNLVQLADMIAGAARRSVERDKDASYLKIVKKRIVSPETAL
ncbi:DUF3800 domain-containing protein [Candidatus Saccharibacteria bacterium]|nr:DUF3800 domain-containing protein [Candidatus Saccharibacteria bacterium]